MALRFSCLWIMVFGEWEDCLTTGTNFLLCGKLDLSGWSFPSGRTREQVVFRDQPGSPVRIATTRSKHSHLVAQHAIKTMARSSSLPCKSGMGGTF